MKHHLLNSAAFGTVVLLASSSVALAAPAPVSGFIALGWGATWTDMSSSGGEGDSDTVFVFNGQARVNAWLDPGMSIQLDVEGEGTPSINQDANCGNCDWDGRSGGIFGAHLSWRDPRSHLIGVFGGFGAEANLDYDGTFTNFIGGVEGQYYWDHVTLYGQAGFAPLMSNSDENEPDNLWFLRAVGRYFTNPNDRLQAEFGYANSDIVGETGQFNIYNWGASWRHRFDTTPYAVGIEYSGFRIENDSASNQDATENQLTVSFSIAFGDSTLEQADREGATLDMPKFNTAGAWSWWVGR